MKVHDFNPTGLSYSKPTINHSPVQQTTVRQIKVGYNNSVYPGSPVVLNNTAPTTGGIGYLANPIADSVNAKYAAAGEHNAWFGVFLGLQVEGQGGLAGNMLPGASPNYYTANTSAGAGAVLLGYVDIDASAQYTIQAKGVILREHELGNARVVCFDPVTGLALGGSAITQGVATSGAYLDASTVDQTSSGLYYNVKILGLVAGYEYGDENPVVLVQINNHCLRAPARTTLA